MAVPLQQFVQLLEDSGIISDDSLHDFIPPKASPKDAEELASELVRQKKLTKFQADEISRGNAKSLVPGNYILMEQIGAGGMGRVFKARHRVMNRIVAIKFLPVATTSDSAAIARFKREVKAVAMISHPNIVAAYDADCADGVHFLVMECVDGSDLSALVRQYGPFPVDQAVNYVLQAAEGLEAAHNKGIVHRGIKPSNLLVNSQGKVKILDLGLARFSGEANGASEAELTTTGTVMGTADYMAPEQAEDTKSADARADIYSLGCSLYYLLTGKPIYGGDSLMNRMMAHRVQPIPSLRETRPEVPELLETAFRKMVAKNIEDRYQTMIEVIDGLEHCGLGNEPSTIVQRSVVPASDTNPKNVPNGTDSNLTKPLLSNAATRVLTEQRKKKPLLIGGTTFGAFMLLAGLAMKLNPMTESLDVKPAMSGADMGSASTTRKPLAFELPGFDNWVKKVAALPAEKQIEAVSRKLVELNPGFDGKVTGYNQEPSPQIENGIVTKFGFSTDSVTDISPVRALTGLVWLWCAGSGIGQGQLADLSPLKGMMTLNFVSCSYSKVSDLSPLTGMSLVSLGCGGTQVSDLSPVKGMLLNVLHCGVTPISDLSVLQGMPLNSLIIAKTEVADLRPLAGMPLVQINCCESRVVDLTPLKDLPLKDILVDFQPARDTESLRSIKTLKTINFKLVDEFWREIEEQQRRRTPLAYLTAGFDQWMDHVTSLTCEKQIEAVRQKLVELNPGFDGKVIGFNVNTVPLIENRFVRSFGFVSDEVTDISPVRALRGLLHFWCSGRSHGRLADLSPLNGLALQSLGCNYTRVSDLTPAMGGDLRLLDANFTRVSDLSPLKGKRMTWLAVIGTPVTDISMLQGMPLDWLGISFTEVADLSALKQMPLTVLYIEQTQVADLSLLRELRLKTLTLDFKPSRDTELLRSITTLEQINHKPAAEFWKEVEQQTKGKK